MPSTRIDPKLVFDNRQLKNRKSARECRKKRKEERNGMMDELIQLRNDKIKLMAEVEVLTKQLQRLEENERQAKKVEVTQPASSPSTNGGRNADKRAGSNCPCANGQNQGTSERNLQAKIDEALSSKFQAYSSMFELKVTEIVQNELKKLTSQTLEKKSSRSLFDDDLKTHNLNQVKNEIQSPETNSVSC